MERNTVDVKVVENIRRWILCGPLLECSGCGKHWHAVPEEEAFFCPGCGKKIRKPARNG